MAFTDAAYLNEIGRVVSDVCLVCLGNILPVSIILSIYLEQGYNKTPKPFLVGLVVRLLGGLLPTKCRGS